MDHESGQRPFLLADGWVTALAGAATAGAWFGGGPGRVAGLAVVAVSLLLRRPAVLLVGVLVLAAGLADAARAGLDPVTPGAVSGRASLTTDPVALDGGGQRVLVRLDGRRYDAVAFGSAAALLRERRAGEEVEVSGTVRPLAARSAWAASRRLVGRLTIERVGAHRASTLANAANAIHRTLDRGSSELPTATRGLLAGVVLGDDRAQLPEVVDDFRGAGLGHLTAVSGQNVAFLIAAAGPVLTRLRWRSRLPATVLMLVFFAVVVRFEPSVLRAGAMAAIATTAAALGRPADGVRTLGLAVTALLLIDPLLVSSLGFGLSVAASAAIAVLSPRLAERLPGPQWLVEPLAVTLAAQVGVAPLLLGRPDGLPVAALPANLLAVAAAGPLMIWGLTAGLVAGLLPSLATVLHVPTAVLSWWILGVARWASDLPIAPLGVGTAAAMAATVLLLAVCRRHRWCRPAAVVVSAALGGALLLPPTPLPGASALGDGATLWSSAGDAVLAIDGPVSVDDTFAALRRRGRRCVAVVAVERGGRSAGVLVAALARRCDGLRVVASAGVAHPGWFVLEPGQVIAAGSLRIMVGLDGEVAVGRARASQ